MAARFYNPGTKIEEMLKFDHPTNDPRHQNNISYYRVVAEEKSFFELPTEIEVVSDGQTVPIAVRFAERFKQDWKAYGCVYVNPKLKGKKIAEDDNLAASDNEAQEKGDRLWREYLIEKAREWVTNVEQVRAVGGVPMRAKGVAAYALKFLNMTDPADSVGNAVAKQTDDLRVAALEKQLEELKQLVGAKK